MKKVNTIFCDIKELILKYLNKIVKRFYPLIMKFIRVTDLLSSPEFQSMFQTSTAREFEKSILDISNMDYMELLFKGKVSDILSNDA